MTTYEHAMLGITGVLATGLDRRYGWSIVALAAVAAVSPDWDGLTILAGSAAFAASHRLWGHNVLACVLSGLLMGVVDYRFDLVTRCGRFFARKLQSSKFAFRAEVAEFPRIRAVAGWAPPSATPRILANSATRNFEGCSRPRRKARLASASPIRLADSSCGSVSPCWRR